MPERLVTVGIDLALRSRHKAMSLAADEMKPMKCRPFDTDPDDLTDFLESTRENTGKEGRREFLMEPTSHAWFPVARWLKSQGETVYLIRPEKVADARRYLRKHTKTDAVDATTLAWLGQHDREKANPARLLPKKHAACFRLCKQRARYAARVGRLKTRIRDRAELAVPGLHKVLSDPFTRLGRKLLSKYMDPHRPTRLGLKRFSKVCRRAGHGPVDPKMIEKLYEAFVRASRLYSPATEYDLDFEVLQSEITDELDDLCFMERKIKKLDARIESLYREIDPNKVLQSIPGIGPIVGAALTSKVGNIGDFRNISAFRSSMGMVSRSKQTSDHDQLGLRITKAGNNYLKQYLYMAAEIARQWDPEMAEFYRHLVCDERKHHKVAIVALANKLAGRVYAVLKRAAAGRPLDEVLYEIRDLQGRPVSKSEARGIALEIARRRKEERSTGAAPKDSPKVVKGDAPHDHGRLVAVKCQPDGRISLTMS